MGRVPEVRKYRTTTANRSTMTAKLKAKTVEKSPGMEFRSVIRFIPKPDTQNEPKAIAQARMPN